MTNYIKMRHYENKNHILLTTLIAHLAQKLLNSGIMLYAIDLSPKVCMNFIYQFASIAEVNFNNMT